MESDYIVLRNGSEETDFDDKQDMIFLMQFTISVGGISRLKVKYITLPLKHTMHTKPAMIFNNSETGRAVKEAQTIMCK